MQRKSIRAKLIGRIQLLVDWKDFINTWHFISDRSDPSVLDTVTKCCFPDNFDLLGGLDLHRVELLSSVSALQITGIAH